MSKILKTIHIITIILISLPLLKGQEIKRLGYNHAILNARAEGKVPHQKSTITPIQYTDSFFEDFSDYRGSVFPKNNHFTDPYAYINSTWADSMISLGVATLDAYDQNGYPWYSLDSGLVHSDTLSSQPFDFVGTPPDTLFFSFFYQAGGKGDLPEGIISEIPGENGEDALMVDFYNPSTEKWTQVFYTIDNTKPHQFNKVEIPLADSLRQDGFRFRFRNYTSLQSDVGNGDPGMLENDDMWHIDYIRLMSEPSDADTHQLGDLTITRPLLPSLKEYTSVPWTHFSLAQSTIERRTVPLTVQDWGANNGNSLIFQRVYQTKDLVADETLRTRDLEREFEGYESFTFTDDFTTGFYFNDSDTIGILQLKAFVETEIDQPRQNDTVVRKDVFYDHYAYDDGSAEAGYGIGGEYQDLSKIALRFRAFKRSDDPDYLKAVLIYFTKSVDSITADAGFKIEIRKNKGPKPSDEVLYVSEEEYFPDYSAEINEFTRIEIDPPVALSDTFFIVIHQLDGYLNIGYDINNDNLHNIYNYVNSEWSRPVTSREGTPMIRASFGDYTLPTEINMEEDQIFSVYPNPARNLLNLQLPGDPAGPVSMQIFDILGRLKYSEYSNQKSISLSDLSRGIYLIVVSSQEERYSSKFIVE